jgi:uncharacterized cupin superfamily protein
MQDIHRKIQVISPAEAPKMDIFGATLSVLSSSSGAPVVVGEQTVPPGYGAPIRLHQSDGESFYILEGELTLIGADGEINAPAGSFVEIPYGVPYRFCNDTDESARMLVMLSLDVRTMKTLPDLDRTARADQPTSETIDSTRHGSDRSGRAVAPQWLRDPLSHPELRKMSVTELADLPFDPRRVSEE